MKRYLLVCLVTLTTALNAYSQSLEVSDVEMLENSVKTFEIALKSYAGNDFVSFQMDLTLPEGISINKEGCALTTRITDEEQELVIGKIGDNTYRLVSTSFTFTPISGYSGGLIHLSIMINGECNGGIATLNNICFVNSNSKRYVLDDVSFKITVHHIINFADATVKSICVKNWDKNYDGNLDTGEAASVSSLNSYFKGKQITSFNEFQYFRLMSIGMNEFSGCTKMTSIIIPNSVQYIYDQAFRNCTGLTLLVIPNSVTTISKSAFYNCSGLTSLEIPNSVTSIGEYAFEGCSSLKTLSIPNSITTIDFRTFGFCDNLTSVIIPNSVTTIGSGAFYNCYNLPSVDIPNSVTSIGAGAFGNCDKLTSLIVNWDVPISVDADIFNDCSKVTLHVPVGCKAAYMEADYWKDFKQILDGTEEESIIVDGFEYEIISETEKTTKLVAGPNANNVVIPSSFVYNNETYSVIAINDRAFVECGDISTITIPNGITSIGNYAFAECYGLTSVEIPNSVTSIEKDAFDYCRNLKTIKFGNGLTSVGNSAFNFCHSLEKVIVPDIASWCSVSFGDSDSNPLYHANHLYSDENTEITDLIIPSGVTTISQWAFLKCLGLKAVTIPSSVTSMGDNAFEECNSLTSVTVNWEEPININTSPFESPSNIVLYVPAGCKSAYESADYWKDFKEIIEIGSGQEEQPDPEDPSEEIDPTDISTLTDAIYANAATGLKGGDCTLTVCLKNEQATSAYSFDLKLPEGVSLAKDGDDEYVYTLSNRHNGHSPSVNYNETTGVYSFAVLSLSSKEIKNNDGAIWTLKLNVAENMEIGDYAIKIQNAKYSLTSGSAKVTMPEVTTILTIEDYKKGDVNGDGDVDIADAVCIVNHVVGKPTPTFITAAVDVNNDGDIDIADAVRIVNLVVGKIPALAPRRDWRSMLDPE